MLTTYISFFLILFFACIISGLVGFGSNILALPFLSLFLDVKTIVPVLILTVIFNGVPRLLQQYRSINLRIYFIMVPLALLGGLAGVQLATMLHEGWMKLILAILMLLIAVKGLVELKGILKIRVKEKQSPVLLVFPFLAGVMQAAFACGGPLFNMYILLNLTQKEQIRATQFAISTTTAIVVILQYLKADVYQGTVLNYVYLLIPAVLFAYFVSEKIFKKIDGKQFLELVYIILILAGIITAWQAVHLL